MKILFILMMLSFWANPTSAQDKNLVCSYNHGSKEIKLSNTHKIQKHELIFPDGIKQIVVINDPWTLNNLDNYIVLSKGEYSITYSLDCKKITVKTVSNRQIL